MLNRKHALVVAEDSHVADVFARECFTYNPDDPSFDLQSVSAARTCPCPRFDNLESTARYRVLPFAHPLRCLFCRLL